MLVIDMQEGSFTPRAARHDSIGLIERLNQLAARLRDAAGTVIFIQHAGDENDPHHPSQPGHKLLHELKLGSGDRAVVKRSCDAFLNTVLNTALESLTRCLLLGEVCARRLATG
jgi:nicotinamidase-related amidase